MIAIERKQHAIEGEADSEGTWAISYGDMITLLLTFFILFFNINKNSAQSTKALQDSLIARISAQVEKTAPQTVDSKNLPIPALDVGNEQDHGVDARVAEKLGAKIHKMGQSLLVEFPNVSFYNFTKTELSPEGMAALKRFTSLYLPYAGQNQLIVRAYTDDRPVIQGAHRYKDNLELSLLRSLSAVRALQKAGLPLNRMKPGGFGEIRFNDEAKLLKGNPMSRKVVLVIEPETAPESPKGKNP